MSRVFVAEETRFRRRVVIKLLSPELAAGLSAERFEREIALAAGLQQANIVPVISAGDVEGLPWYSMPYVDGESLRTRIGRGTVPIAEVIAILRDVVRALKYAHERGIVHRDIKPDNVLLSGDAAVVTDFGIAKAVSAARTSVGSAALTQMGMSIGTPAYMAPEQAAGDPDVDHRADLYSLGCMAFELLAGRPVFAERTPQRMLAAHMTEAPPRLAELRPDCPPGLASLVMGLLEKVPEKRPQSAAELLSALDAVTTSGSSASMPASLVGGHRRLLPMLAAYAVAFALVVLVTKAAIVVIGLPEWVVPGAIVVMALGLPAILWTAYVQRVTRHMVTATPTLTPGGTMMPSVPQGTMATMAVKMSPHVSWRRTIRGGYYAVGGFVLLVAAFMAMRTLGIGPARTLFAAGTLNSDDKLLVSGFTFSPASDSALAPILTEGVRNALGQSRVIRLLEPSDVAMVMGQMKRTGDIAANDTLAREVAQRAGATALVSGRVAHSANAYAVSLELRRATNGDVLASYQEIAGSPKELLEVVDALTHKLRGKMGESLRAVNRSVPLEQATTSSLEALRLYSEGTRANDVDGDYDRAIVLLRQAVAIDTTFALAWRKLSMAIGNGRYSRASSDSASAQAMKFADRLPDRERGLVLGRYYGLDARGPAGYETAYAADSNSWVAAQQLSQGYVTRRDYARALRFARRTVAIRHDPNTVAYLAMILAQTGDAAGAQALVDSVVRSGARLEGSSAFQLARVAAAYALGRIDSVRSIGESMRQSAVNRVRLDAITSLGKYARLRGHLTKALQLDGEVASLPAGMGRTPPLIDSLETAYTDLWFSNAKEKAVRRLDALLASPAYRQADARGLPDVRLAELYAMADEPSKAKAALVRAETATPARWRASSGSALRRLRGEIALAEKRYADAIREYRASDVEDDGRPTACESCSQFGLARVFDAAKQSDSAIVSFERYLAVPAAARWSGAREEDRRPAVEKRLGELYDAKGDRAKAIAHYTTFVDLWKNADPELQPAVDAVRRRLKEIAGREGK